MPVFMSMQLCSGRAYAGIRAVEEQAYNEQNGHSACSGNQSERKNTVGMPRECNASQRTVKIG